MDSTLKMSIHERLALLDLVDVLDQISTAAEFCICMDTDMQRIFPHEMMVCGIANLEGENIMPYRMLLNHFPQAYMDSLRTADGGINSALIERWRATRKPVLVELDHNIDDWPATWVENARKHGFKNFAQHGFIDFAGATGSSFAFSGLPGRLRAKHAYILTHIVPHLHIALMKSMTEYTEPSKPPSPPSTIALTSRQQEVLQWLSSGKTNWEIGQILGTTEDTIKYHLSQIFSKLHVSSRAQAVAEALRLNIIK